MYYVFSNCKNRIKEIKSSHVRSGPIWAMNFRLEIEKVMRILPENMSSASTYLANEKFNENPWNSSLRAVVDESQRWMKTCATLHACVPIKPRYSSTFNKSKWIIMKTFYLKTFCNAQHNSVLCGEEQYWRHVLYRCDEELN